MTIDHKLFMWGSGVFGDFEEPKEINITQLMRSENPIELESVKVGGNFTLLQDNKKRVYCWGSDYYREHKSDDGSWATVKAPKKILDARDKVTGLAVGGYFAVCY